MQTGASLAPEHDATHHIHANGNGFLSKIGKVSPLLALVVGLGGGFFGNQVASSVQSGKQEEKIVQLQAIQTKLMQDIEQLRIDVVPRSEHQAMLRDNEILNHWIEKYNDAMQTSLQHQIDELRGKR